MSAPMTNGYVHWKPKSGAETKAERITAAAPVKFLTRLSAYRSTRLTESPSAALVHTTAQALVENPCRAPGVHGRRIVGMARSAPKA